MALGKALAIAAATLAMTIAAHAADLPPAKVNIVDWPRMSVADFGCLMEKTLGRRDFRFNCSLRNYTNTSDPCVNVGGYDEGPAFPKELATAVHPLARLVSPGYERGMVMAVHVHLNGKFDRDEVLKAFSIPTSPSPLPENILQVSIQDHCDPDVTCVLITGFEHQGAADVDCDAVRKTVKPKRP